MQGNENFLESRIQQECFMWHWNYMPEERGQLFMVYNTPRNVIQGSILKGMGMVKGVSDMIYLQKGKVSFLEFKMANKYQTKEQLNFERLAQNLGFNYFVITSLEQFKEVVYGSCGG